MAWAYKGTITITGSSTLLPSTQTNFPVLVKLDSVNCTVSAVNRIKTTANGGAVQNTGTQSGGNAVTMPFDLAFYSDSGLTTKIPWEVESYDGTGGTLWVWVLVASCALSGNLYFGLGDAAVNTQQNTAGNAPSAVWDSNYKTVYHLPNGSTLSLVDSTSNGNTGVLPGGSNNPTAAAGQIDGGANFNQASMQYFKGTNPVHASSGLITVEAWVKPTAAGNDSVIASVWTTGAGTNNEWDLYSGIDTGNAHKFSFLVQQTNNSVIGVVAPTIYTDGNWYHIAAVADGTNIWVYVNGVGTSAAYNGTINVGSTAPLDIGAFGASPLAAYTMNGVIDEARVSNTNRSANWIMAAYQNGFDPQTFAAVSLAVNTGGSSSGLFRPSTLSGLGAGGPFFQNPLG